MDELLAGYRGGEASRARSLSFGGIERGSCASEDVVLRVRDLALLKLSRDARVKLLDPAAGVKEIGVLSLQASISCVGRHALLTARLVETSDKRVLAAAGGAIASAAPSAPPAPPPAAALLPAASTVPATASSPEAAAPARPLGKLRLELRAGTHVQFGEYSVLAGAAAFWGRLPVGVEIYGFGVKNSAGGIDFTRLGASSTPGTSMHAHGYTADAYRLGATMALPVWKAPIGDGSQLRFPVELVGAAGLHRAQIRSTTRTGTKTSAQVVETVHRIDRLEYCPYASAGVRISVNRRFGMRAEMDYTFTNTRVGTGALEIGGMGVLAAADLRF